jgi:fructose-bisphosphate aldolase class II
MTRSTLTELLRDAATAGRGLGAFNVVLLEHAEAIVAGAESAGLPVVLQISENCIRYHGSLAPITLASRAIADAASDPVIVHLDHIEDEALVREGITLGVDSVMFDASKLDYATNVEHTRAMADFAHAHGVAIEAEVGEVGGKDGVHAAGARTDPREASEFVAQTGVDALAVAVGTSHAMQSRVASVDRDLIARLHAAVPVPLVLHGSSGLSDDELTASIAAGMTKINISTHLNGLFTGAVRGALAADPALVDPRKYVTPGRTAVATEVARLLTLLAG